tara:strand:- start:2749 stop:2961 length:213 start_codon:yes stop_codon:yes gene_type:complete
MKEFIQQFTSREYFGVNWLTKRIKEPSSWAAISLGLLATAMIFSTYSVFCIGVSACCAVIAFILKEHNVD